MRTATATGALIYLLHEALEPFAIARSAPLLEASACAELRELTVAMTRVANAGNPAAWIARLKALLRDLKSLMPRFIEPEPRSSFTVWGQSVLKPRGEWLSASRAGRRVGRRIAFLRLPIGIWRPGLMERIHGT